MAQEEDRELLLTAWMSGFRLEKEKMEMIATKPRDPDVSWPLPRTPLHIQARLEWLAAKFAEAQAPRGQ